MNYREEYLGVSNYREAVEASYMSNGAGLFTFLTKYLSVASLNVTQAQINTLKAAYTAPEGTDFPPESCNALAGMAEMYVMYADEEEDGSDLTSLAKASLLFNQTFMNVEYEDSSCSLNTKVTVVSYSLNTQVPDSSCSSNPRGACGGAGSWEVRKLVDMYARHNTRLPCGSTCSGLRSLL